MKNKVVVVCGPTGIGKTSFAIRLANAFGGEIVNADSMQIYRYMDIGTAKPTPREQRLAVHHMIDVVDPDQAFDAGMYARQASAVITGLHDRGRLPVITGGTGLYIKALLYGLFRTRPLDQALMSRLETELAEQGAPALHRRLEKCDPAAAGRIHPNDGFRIVRALEIFGSSGCPMSRHQEGHRFDTPRYHAVKIGLTMDRADLYDRINRRVDIMFEQGLIGEVSGLMERGYAPDLKSMQSIGYKHAGMFLEKKYPLDRCAELMKRDTRRYAKRQFTWFNHQDTWHWLHPDQIDRAVEMVKEFLT